MAAEVSSRFTGWLPKLGGKKASKETITNTTAPQGTNEVTGIAPQADIAQPISAGPQQNSEGASPANDDTPSGPAPPGAVSPGARTQSSRRSSTSAAADRKVAFGEESEQLNGTWRSRKSGKRSTGGQDADEVESDDAEEGHSHPQPGSESVSASRIEFYHQGQDYFWLSNSAPFPVFYDGIKYPTAEHLFQASKFFPDHPEVAVRIRKASGPMDAIHLARKNIRLVKQGWIGGGGNVDAMRSVLLLKFTQHSALREKLLLTGEAELVETSRTDAFWGGGLGGQNPSTGRNELGKALASTRELLRTAAGLGYGSAAKTV